MRVEGIVDPLILNQVQGQTANQQVPETGHIKVSTGVKGRQQERGQDAESDLRQSAEQLNKVTEAFNVELRFKVDKENNQLYVYVVDVAKGEVLRRIPPENIIEAARRAQEVLGLILNALI